MRPVVSPACVRQSYDNNHARSGAAHSLKRGASPLSNVQQTSCLFTSPPRLVADAVAVSQQVLAALPICCSATDAPCFGVQALQVLLVFLQPPLARGALRAWHIALAHLHAARHCAQLGEQPVHRIHCFFGVVARHRLRLDFLQLLADLARQLAELVLIPLEHPARCARRPAAAVPATWLLHGLRQLPAAAALTIRSQGRGSSL